MAPSLLALSFFVLCWSASNPWSEADCYGLSHDPSGRTKWVAGPSISLLFPL